MTHEHIARREKSGDYGAKCQWAQQEIKTFLHTLFIETQSLIAQEETNDQNNNNNNSNNTNKICFSGCRDPRVLPSHSPRIGTISWSQVSSIVD